MKYKKPDIRYLKEMKDVLYDREWLKKASNFELYYMYRGIKRKNGLRYDITVIPPRMLGKEFVKTKGHEHSGNFGEVYIVLSGRAIYLIQRCRKGKVEDVYAVKAKKGETVIVPPGYGHITINPGPKELKEANWCDERCKNIYDLYEKKQGACYFAIAQKSKIKNQKSKIRWIKNKSYGKVPKLRFEKPLNPVRKAKILKALEILKFSNGVKKMPKNLDFLKGK